MILHLKLNNNNKPTQFYVYKYDRLNKKYNNKNASKKKNFKHRKTKNKLNTIFYYLTKAKLNMFIIANGNNDDNGK